ILNPLDRRRFAWDISFDVDDEPTAINFSAALIKPEGEDDFWAMSARGILTSILMFLINQRKPWNLRDVLNIVREPELVRQAVKDDDFNKIIAQGLTGVNERSGANDFLITLSQYMSRYKALAALMNSAKEGQRISLKRLIKSEQYGRIALVLGNDEDSRETIKLFNGLVFEMLVNYTLSLEDSRSRRIWALIDELASVADYVGRNLSRFQEKCRSKGGSAIVATQSYPALVAKLGPDYTDQIIELCKHKVIPGGVDGKTAEVLSDSYFGSVEVITTQYGESKEYSDSNATPEEHDVKPTFSRTTRPLVRKEALYSSSMPKTGPQNGLTGFFFGSAGGPHFHTFSWQEVMDMRVEEADVLAYERIAMDDAGLTLTLWSDEELVKWGLSLSSETADDLTEDEPTLSRLSILEKLDVTDSELKDICLRAELSEDKESFAREDLINIFARVGADFLQIDLEEISYD
ncbi:MAG: type IV secretion system DNA-binding domain-containing protein, partial [Leptolyngbya sp. SIO3F4]|nr:type IV secretion system DNA-binding domain-containing protein [Leptolyngbya sp. SIO3F4]